MTTLGLVCEDILPCLLDSFNGILNILFALQGLNFLISDVYRQHGSLLWWGGNFVRAKACIGKLNDGVRKTNGVVRIMQLRQKDDYPQKGLSKQRWSHMKQPQTRKENMN